MLNLAAIEGRLVADPELKTTPSGVSVCSFTVACDRSYAKPGEQRQADFIDVTAWRATAEFVCKYFRKGSLILVDGRIATRTYQAKDGGNRKAFGIQAENINFAGGKRDAQAEPSLDDGGYAAPGGSYQQTKAAPAYAAGADDFAIIPDEGDLPF